LKQRSAWAIVVLAPSFIGCFTATDAWTLPALEEGSWAVFNVTGPVEGSLKLAVGPRSPFLDRFGREAEAHRLDVGFDGEIEGHGFPPHHTEYLDGEGNLIAVDYGCRYDEESMETCEAGRTVINYGMRGTPSFLGVGPLFGRLRGDAGPALNALDPRYRSIPAPAGSSHGCRLIEVSAPATGGGSTWSSGISPWLIREGAVTLCDGVPFPTAIRSGPYKFTLQQYARGQGGIISTAHEHRAVPPVELARMRGRELPEGEPGPIGIAEALEWAREHDGDVERFLRAHPSAAIQSARFAYAGCSRVVGNVDRETYTMTILLQSTASTAALEFKVQKDILNNPLPLVGERETLKVISKTPMVRAPPRDTDNSLILPLDAARERVAIMMNLRDAQITNITTFGRQPKVYMDHYEYALFFLDNRSLRARIVILDLRDGSFVFLDVPKDIWSTNQRRSQPDFPSYRDHPYCR